METSEKQRPNQSLKDSDVLKSVFFSLLPETGLKTLQEISNHTGLPSDVVSDVLSKSVKNGKIVQSTEGFSLTRETEHHVSIIEAMERDMTRRQKFEKYKSNPEYKAEITTGKQFDAKAAEIESGAFQFERDISPHVKAYCFQHRVHHIWNEGPRKGEAFYSEEKVSENEVATTTIEEFLATITRYLQELSEQRSYTTLSDMRQYILRVCYGTDELIGWEKARFYDLGGEGLQINILMRSMMDKGLYQFLVDYANSQGISIESWIFNFQDRDLVPLYYDGLEPNNLRDNRWRDPWHPLMLTHGTYSHIFPNLVQMRGLAARNYYQSLGIKKYYGGESQGSGSYTPNDVSFSYHEDGSPKILGGHGSQRAYDYPIKIGIAKEQAEKLQLSLGSMDLQEELVVRNFVPIDLIMHIFVPSFKVKEVTELFRQNGFEHIRVLALKQEIR